MKITKEQRQKEQNKKYKTLIKNRFKKIEEIIDSIKPGDKFENFSSDLDYASKETQRFIDKAARKGIIHKNNAARKVKRVFKMVNLAKVSN